MFRFLLYATFGILLSSVCAQEAGGLHQFTDKKGQQITAVLLGISEDRRMMKIRREDGLEFETEITLLSLDDQQYIKDWMKNQPDPSMIAGPEKTDYRLEIEIDENLENTERHERDSYYGYEQRLWNYEIVARNLSRETLPAAKLEYLIVWREQLRVYQDSEGNWTYSSSSSSEDSRVRISGEADLGEMVYNRDVSMTTSFYEIDRYLFDGDVYREDELIGIIARIVSPSGTVLAEVREGDSDLDSLTWEKAASLEKGKEPEVEEPN